MSTDPFKERVNKPRPKQPLVLSKSKLNDLILNSQSGQDEKAGEKVRLEERKKRQEATKALSKLIAQRKEPGSELRKRQYAQDAKTAKEEQESEDRIEVRRNYVLDQAYKRLYEDTDRVKYFKTAKNLTEMLHQRDKQLEATANMKDSFSRYDKECLLGMMRDIDNHEREEHEKIEKVVRDKKKNAEIWSKEIEKVQEKRMREEWEFLRDGYIIREEAENYVEEVQKAKLEQKKKIQEYKTMLDKQKDEKRALLDMYAKLDEADEKRAEIFNDAKKDMKMKHKEIKEELDKRKELKRQYVANNMRDEGAARKMKEEASLQKAILESEAKNKEECAIKQANQEEALKSIQDFYERTMETKVKRDIEEKRENYHEGRKIRELVENQLNADESTNEAKTKSEKETQHVQLHQMAKKQMDKHAEKMEDVKDYLNHIRSLYDEEEVFQKYAQMEIDHCETQGMNTKSMRYAARPGIECGKGPLYKERGSIRPRYYAAISQGDELNRIERVPKVSDTKSRLGFMLH